MSSTGAGTHKFILRSKSSDSVAASSADGVGLSVDQLHVVGIATFPAAVTLTNVNISQINVSGLSTFNDAIDINATSEFSQPVNINATFNANGDVNLGNATSDTITATGRFDSDLVPSTDGSRDLGASSLEWQDLFIDGTAKIDTLTVDENATIAGNLTVGGNSIFNGNVDLGNASSDAITLIGRFDSHLIPATDGLHDLGSSTLEWRDLFIDGTAHIDTLDVDANAGIIGNLTVTGTSEFNNTVDVDADFAVRNGTTDKFFVDNVTGNTNIEGTLTADGHTELNSTLNVDSNTTVGGNLTVSGKIQPSAGSGSGNGIHWADNPGGGTGDNASITYFVESGENTKLRIATGNDADDEIELATTNSSFTKVTSTLDASSSTTGAFRTDGGVGIAKKLYVGTNLNVGGTLNVSSSATVNSLKVSDLTNNRVVIAGASGEIEDSGNLTFNGSTLALTGAQTISSTLTVSSSASIGADLAVGGELNMMGSSSSNKYLDVNIGTHSFNLRGTSGGDANHILMMRAVREGTVELNFNGTTRLSTTNTGVSVNGTASATLFSGSGASLTSLNADRLTDGTVHIDRLGSGTKDGTTFLAGDNTFKQVTVAINNATNQGDNRVVTSSGTGSVNGETNLTFDNVSLHVHGGSRQIVCDGNIVAFNSDIRLKTAIQPIENAVAKTLKLNGFTYEHNEVAESIGYKLDGERFAGVSAQDVQSVLPEAVKPAPADPNYLTVQYEKIVPLLIEAIKELKAEIDELKK